MVLYECQKCLFSTKLLSNYNRHLKTQKHLKNDQKMRENEGNVQNVQIEEGKKNEHITKENPIQTETHSFFPQFKCQFCQKNFSRADNLRRHISVCKLSQKSVLHNFAPICTNLHIFKNDFECQHCQRVFTRKSSLLRHLQTCKNSGIGNQISQSELKIKLLEKDLEKEKALNEQKQKTLELVSKMKPSQVTNHITNNNKTINYLNTHFGEMIDMEKFLYNLQHTEQLTHHEREMLLMAYKDNGIELFAKSFSHIMKENCRRQLLKEGLPDFPMLPLYCSDGNLRSHKEKDSKGWKTHYDNQSINTMINISSDQVYESHRHPLYIDGRDRKKVFKQVKQDNHAQRIEDSKLVMDHDEDS